MSRSGDLQIVKYDPRHRQAFENLRREILKEGNESLSVEKLNPDTLDGHLLICYLNGEAMSLSAAEASHYTGDPKISCRICRYHVLERYRKLFPFCGFQMLRQHCQWADSVGFKVIYWTHDIQNRPLNQLYQKKRKYTLGANASWFADPYFVQFELERTMLFQVSPKSKMLQFIYSRKNPSDFLWNPPANILHVENVLATDIIQQERSGSREYLPAHQD